jgi:hypothetical protein
LKPDFDLKIKFTLHILFVCLVFARHTYFCIGLAARLNTKIDWFGSQN